jgi:hypothetical protein
MSKPVIQRAVILILWLSLMTACAIPIPTPVVLQQLRIVNAGSSDITGLVVLFPGVTALAEAIPVEFGDVPAGTTTEYRHVPSGVYRYAAYDYTLDGRTVQQPVVDWVGETPMPGARFAYSILLDLEKQPGGQIQLIEVKTDTP